MAEIKFNKRYLIWLGLALALAAVLKFWLVAGQYVPFNSDEAVVALMARHILGGARPIFFYGQAYMGSLDAFLVAGAFAIFGQQVWVIRLVQGLLYLGTLGTTAWLGKTAFDSWEVGSLAALLLAVPVVNVTLYTTASLGGYGEALLFGNLILICGLRIANYLKEHDQPGPLKFWLFLGFLSGIGLWAFGITLVYSLAVAFILGHSLVRMATRIRTVKADQESELDVFDDKRTITRRLSIAFGIALLGVILGSLPWWGYSATQGFEKMIWELRGGAISGVEELPWLLWVGQHFTSFVLLGGTVLFGLRPPWEVGWLALPLLPFVLIFWMAVFVHVGQSLRDVNKNRASIWLLLCVILILALGFVLTPFGADPSGRYFLPISIPLALFAATLILRTEKRVGKLFYGLIIFLLVFNLWGTLQSALKFPPGITTQFYKPAQVDHRYMEELITFLNENNESYGYSNYWLSYPLAFLSEEEIIFVPRLPYHPDFRYTERDDRYSPYDEAVEKASRVAYITSNHPDLDLLLRDKFAGLGVTWREHTIGDYQIFYDLSQVVRPADIGLGSTSP